MNATALDTITSAFVDSMKTGAGALAQYSIPLLAVFAIMAFYVQIGALTASGGGQVGDTLAASLLHVLKVGVFYWLLTNFVDLATAAFLTFLQWGITPTGGGLSPVMRERGSLKMDYPHRRGSLCHDLHATVSHHRPRLSGRSTLG